MKRLLIIVMLVLGASCWAQAPDSTRSDTRELGSDKPQRSRERNLIGAPVYYDTLGNVRGSADTLNRVARLPKHHYFNRLSNDFSTYFVEVEGLIGYADLAFGINFTYLPERWGFYGSCLAGIRRNYLTFGPALRLSGYGDSYDWHLYGGAVVSRHLGVEGGIRFAQPRDEDDFCWMSASVGGMFVNGHGFFTCGLSLELSALTAISVFWW